MANLTARDSECHTRVHEVEVGHGQRGQFRAAQRRGQPEQQQGAVAPGRASILPTPDEPPKPLSFEHSEGGNNWSA